ncbi:MAG: D-glycerate dehydrogenase [Chloroflexi bacterium]|nr:D-glycerate dehydrogenase [Chloroflexota bacterium]
MERPRVFVTRTVPDAALQLLRAGTDLEVWQGELPPSPGELREKARDAVGLLTTLTDRVDAALLDAAPRLKVVSNVATGTDNVDVAEATRRGVLVGRTPGVLVKTCAEFTMALLLASARRVVESDRYVHQGAWKTWHPMAFLGRDLAGQTLGIAGLGQIGLEVARRALAFEMRLVYFSRTRKHEEERHLPLTWAPGLKELLPQVDFLTLHVPLTPQTRHLIGERELASMKPTAMLVNTSRGPVVDQRALYQALRDGVIAAAALDVTDPEPISPQDPLLALPNVVITPHIASASHATRTRMAVLAAENLLAALEGRLPPHCANPEAFRRP